MSDKPDHPGVYVPPPAFYVAIFLASVALQKIWPISNLAFHTPASKLLGAVLLGISLMFLVASLRQFFISKNTLIPIQSASSLQVTGIYRFSRNPMYLGLALAYLAVACWIGNWWTLILFVLLVMIVQEYIIKREERYLLRAFGTTYQKL